MSGAMTSMARADDRQHLFGEPARQPLLFAALSWAGSQSMPPFAPPNGKFMMPHFHDIHMARAATSPRSTLGWKRKPPFEGPLVDECCTR